MKVCGQGYLGQCSDGGLGICPPSSRIAASAMMQRICTHRYCACKILCVILYVGLHLGKAVQYLNAAHAGVLRGSLSNT